MPDEKQTDDRSLLDRIITVLLKLPWSEALTQLWNMARKVAQRRFSAGMYEVLEYESAHDLLDRGGK